MTKDMPELHMKADFCKNMPEVIYARMENSGRTEWCLNPAYGTRYRRDDTPPQTEVMGVDEWVTAPPHETYDGLKCQFRALKTMLNSMGQQLTHYQKKSYETGEKHLAALKESLESEREMNAKLTEELVALQSQPAKPQDVEAIKREAVVWYTAKFDNTGVVGMPSDREVLFDYIDHLASKGLLTAAPDAGGGE
jgi:hypothetical protein